MFREVLSEGVLIIRGLDACTICALYFLKSTCSPDITISVGERELQDFGL